MAGVWPQVPVLQGPRASLEKLDEMRASCVAVVLTGRLALMTEVTRFKSFLLGKIKRA